MCNSRRPHPWRRFADTPVCRRPSRSPRHRKRIMHTTAETTQPNVVNGSNAPANLQEYLIAAINACMTVGYVAQCAIRGITLTQLKIETEGEINLRGFLGLDPMV